MDANESPRPMEAPGSALRGLSPFLTKLARAIRERTDDSAFRQPIRDEAGRMSQIQHAARCSRPTPTIRTSWSGTPERFCPGCGRAVAVLQTSQEGVRR